MPITLNANLANGPSNLNQTERTFQQLSSGSRINSAADDAAGAAITERLTSQLGGFDAAIRNANDSISSIQVADGALSSLNNNIARIQELTLQAGNGALNDQDRRALQQEADQLISESNRLLENTNFNGKDLLNSDQDISVQLDSAGSKIEVGGRNIAQEFADLGFSELDLSTQASANETLDTLSQASELVISRQSELGAVSNRVENAIDNIASAQVNAAEARSRISDTDYAQASSDLAANLVRNQADIAVQAQANSQRSFVLQLLS